MWRTSEGERTLCGAEANLIRAAIVEMLEQLQCEADGDTGAFPCGVALFDELSWQQRLALLHRVAMALLNPNVKPVELSAVNEATVAAIFARIKQNVIVELDYEQMTDLPSNDDAYYWRRLVAMCQSDEDDEFQVRVDSVDDNDWRLLIEGLENQILWDDDWDMPEFFMDVPPEVAEYRKECLGINSDYFTALAPDLRDTDVPAIFTSLWRLTESID